MAYRFRNSETIAHAIQRVFVEEINWAVGQLSHSKDRVGAVHEARKSLKKIRSLLAAIELQFGDQYRRVDRFFRDAGRVLSQVRDNDVMLQAFDARAKGQLPLVRQNLQRGKREIADEPAVSRDIAHRLTAVRMTVNQWPIANVQFESLVPNLLVSYRNGRKALKRAGRSGTAEASHVLRKYVK